MNIDGNKLAKHIVPSAKQSKEVLEVIIEKHMAGLPDIAKIQAGDVAVEFGKWCAMYGNNKWIDVINDPRKFAEDES
jgi:hypothetical protein